MARRRHPNVVWITIDSARADHTTMGGYSRDTTPNLERIADRSDGQWFDTCIAQTRWTPASTASMLTGTYLSTHRVGVRSPDVRPLPSSLTTLPELLSGLGYTSLGIGTNQYVCSATGMDRGFDRFIFPTARNLHRTVGLRAVADYVRNIRRYGPGLSADRSLHNVSSMATRAAERFASAAGEGEDPWFLYFHYNATHYPYTPPKHFLEPYAAEIGQSVDRVLDTSRRVFDDVFTRVAEGLPLSEAEMAAIEAAYDAELAYVDHLVGRLFDHVTENVSGETMFVVTGDHGETFGEHGWLGHHVLVSEELLRVPLVTAGLPGASGASDGPVQHVDLTRTVAEGLGTTAAQFQGVNLAEGEREYAVVQRASRESDREKLLERDPSIDLDRYRWDALNCVHDGRFKLLSGAEGDQLFALPDEETDVSDSYPRVAEHLAAELADRALPVPRERDDGRDRAEFSGEMLDRLERMGYL
jgi:uncharacterized sulfatase